MHFLKNEDAKNYLNTFSYKYYIFNENKKTKISQNKYSIDDGSVLKVSI